MQINIYSAPNELTSPRIAKAMREATGGVVYTDDRYRKGTWIGFGSPTKWKSLLTARKKGDDFVFCDHAYFNRGNFFRVTKNAWQHSGYGEPDYNRLEITEKPWSTDGSHVLVCPPDEVFADLMGFSAQRWLADTLDRLRKNTDRQIRIRDRSQAGRSKLKDDLKGAWCLVTYTSNAAVEALIEGIPAICTGDCASSRMSLRDPVNVEYPILPPNRREWLGVLAANQWTLHEIKRGFAWRAINQ